MQTLTGSSVVFGKAELKHEERQFPVLYCVYFLCYEITIYEKEFENRNPILKRLGKR